MSTFAIYAFVITGLYIVYMAVAILMDLFGKKGQKKDDSEVFNNSDMSGEGDEERSTVVDETDDGYAVHQLGEEPEIPSDNNADYDDEQRSEEEDNVDDVEQEEQPVDTNPDDEDLLEQESQESQAAYESLKAVQARMDAVQATYQDEYRSDEFAVMMAQPMNQKNRILRQIVNI